MRESPLRLEFNTQRRQYNYRVTIYRLKEQPLISLNALTICSLLLVSFVLSAVGCGTNSGEDESIPSSAQEGSVASSSHTGAPEFPEVKANETEIVPPRVTPDDFNIVWEVWEHLNRDYVDQSKLDGEASAESAIRGITSALGDPHTAYVDPEVLSGSFGDVFEGEFQGIGAHVQMNARGKIIIVSPIEGSPADRAGIRPGDIVLEVDGESLEGLSLLEAVSKIRGPEGSTVALLVKHLGASDPVIIEVVRGTIPLESVTLRSEPGDEFTHVRVTEFFPQTPAKLAEIIRPEIESGAKGIILDLRDNAGGLLEPAVDIASIFVNDGLILYIEYGNKRRTDHSVNQEREYFTTIPMVVLVNGGTASASEILAGALQDHKRAPVIVTTTFGKGSVNWLRRLSNGGGLYITVAHWFTPLGRIIQGNGITPDIEVSDRDARETDIQQLKRAKEELKKLSNTLSLNPLSTLTSDS